MNFLFSENGDDRYSNQEYQAAFGDWSLEENCYKPFANGKILLVQDQDGWHPFSRSYADFGILIREEKENTMYGRFLRMARKYGTLAAYLMLKCETHTLSRQDIELAVVEFNALSDTKCTLINMLAGNLEKNPDLDFLMMEAYNAIAFDLDLNKERYLIALGLWDSASPIGLDPWEGENGTDKQE